MQHWGEPQHTGVIVWVRASALQLRDQKSGDNRPYQGTNATPAGIVRNPTGTVYPFQFCPKYNVDIQGNIAKKKSSDDFLLLQKQQMNPSGSVSQRNGTKCADNLCTVLYTSGVARI